MKTLLHCILLLFVLTLSAEARTWTAKTGDTIDGEFAGLADGTVSIKLPDGRLAQIKLDLLSDADQQFVRTIGGPTPTPPTPPSVVKFGYNTPRNVLEQEAEKGNPGALYFLAQCYGLGMNGCPPDEKKSEELLQRGSQLAETGNPFAQCCRAMCYLRGIGVPEDKAEAAKWYRKAAEQGNAAGQAGLGLHYAKEAGDEVEGVKWLRKAAEQGDALAQFFLGECYINGSGVPKDMTEAAKLFLKSAEQGFIPSQYVIGLCYAHGEGVPADKEEAIKWLRKAVEQGFEEAKKELRQLELGEQENAVELYERGLSYREGDGVPQNYEEAAKYFLKSAELGFAPAQFSIGVCYDTGQGVRVDKPQAAKWYLKAAEQEHELAQYNLGVTYLIGDGIPVDQEEGIRWVRKAADQDYEQAVQLLQKNNIPLYALPFIELKGHPSDVHFAAFSPDGKRIVTDTRAWDDTVLRIWDTESGRELRKLDVSTGGDAVQFSPDSKKLITLSNSYNVHAWDADSGRELRKQELGASIESSVSANSKKVITHGSTDRNNQNRRYGERLYENVQIWDVDTGRLLTVNPKGVAITSDFFGHEGWYPGLRTAVSPDGSKVVSVRQDAKGENSFVQVWDANTGRELRTLGGGSVGGQQPEIVQAVLFSPDGSLVATHGSHVKIWDVQSGRELQSLNGHTGDFSPDGTKIATVGLVNKGGRKKYTVHIWDVKTGRQLTTLGIEGEFVGEVLFSPDGKKIVAHCEVSDAIEGDGLVGVFDVDSGRKLFELKHFPCCFSPDSKTLAVDKLVNADDWRVQMLDAESGKELLRLKGRFGAFSSDGKKLATLCEFDARVWDLSGTSVQTATNNDVPQQVGLQTYTDKEYDFSFTYPGDWSVNPNAAAHICMMGQSDGGYSPNISITPLSPVAGLLRMTKEDIQESFESSFKNLRIIEHGIKQLGGKESLFSHMQGTLEIEGAAQGIPLETWLFLLPHKEKTFRIMITCRQGTLGKNRPIFDAIIRSFQFDQTGAPPTPPIPPPPTPPTNNGATARAENTGATISVDKTTFEVGDKITIHYSGFTKDLLSNYPSIQIRDEGTIYDSEMFLDFISQGKDNIPSSGTIELKLPIRPCTVEVRLNFPSKALNRIVYATIPVTVKPNNDPPPPPQPLGENINAKLVGSWSNVNWDIVARSSDLRIMTFNEDGTFKLVLLPVDMKYYHQGNYSVSNGKMYFTNIVFHRERYNIARSIPDTVVEFVFRRGVEGKRDEFDLNKVLSGTNWMGGTTWTRTGAPQTGN